MNKIIKTTEITFENEFSKKEQNIILNFLNENNFLEFKEIYVAFTTFASVYDDDGNFKEFKEVKTDIRWKSDINDEFLIENLFEDINISCLDAVFENTGLIKLFISIEN